MEIPQQQTKGYNGNALIKRANQDINFTQEMVEEWLKCSQDPIYFTETYMKIINVDHGLVSFKLYDYQKEMLLSMQQNRFNVIATARQAGKSVRLFFGTFFSIQKRQLPY